MGTLLYQYQACCRYLYHWMWCLMLAYMQVCAHLLVWWKRNWGNLHPSLAHPVNCSTSHSEETCGEAHTHYCAVVRHWSALPLHISHCTCVCVCGENVSLKILAIWDPSFPLKSTSHHKHAHLQQMRTLKVLRKHWGHPHNKTDNTYCSLRRF